MQEGWRLYVGDDTIRKDILKLSHLRATTSSSGPAIEHCPQPGLHMLHQFEIVGLPRGRNQVAAGGLSQCRASTRASHENTASHVSNFNSRNSRLHRQPCRRRSLISELICRVPLCRIFPHFHLFLLSTFVVGGSTPGQASPVTPTTSYVASTSPQQ